VLIVDDMELNRSLLAGFLADGGFEVQEAAGWEEALAAVRREPPPDLVLLDLQMPARDGFETLTLLREQGYRGPVLALTAHAGESEAVLRERGFQGVVLKPVRSSELQARLARVIEGSGSGSAAAPDPGVTPGKDPGGTS